MDQGDDRLDSWKAIAAYLGRDRTTVMRWERSAGLPVRRVPGGRGRSVFAYKSDIDLWLASHPTLPDGEGDATPEAPPPALAAAPEWRPRLTGRMRLAAALVAVVSAAAAAALAPGWWRGPIVAKATLVGDSIVAFDASGRDVWRHQLPPVDGTTVPARLTVADLDDDGRPEVLAALHFMPHGGHGSSTVLVLDGRGRVRWQHALEDRYRFGDDEYGPPWYPEDLLVYRSEGSVRVAVAQHHHTWWPGVVVTYDAEGRALARFVNAGWIRSLNLAADGRHLLAAGISNQFGGAALAVLDAARPAGTSPGGAGPLPACETCPAGSPVAYFVAPWSPLARLSDTPDAVVQIDASGGVEWHALQRAAEGGKAPDVIIGLSPRLELVRQGVNEYFTELHAALERSGALAGSKRDGRQPPVREWTPARGWREPPLK